ncbi:MAG: DUF924 family protein [Pseudomonas sp.]
MYQDILDFWFAELEPSAWWSKDEQLDQLIRQRFSDLHRQAALGELWLWRQTAEGRLAEIIVLDQLSRNMFRGQPEAFAQDSLALVLAQEAVAAGVDQLLPVVQRRFIYMPYMHSESLLIHEQALRLFSAPGMEDNLGFEHRHRDILLRFGRYPHRNQILGRQSTEEELAFLTQPGSSF